MSELCVESLWYGEQTNAIARQLNLCYIFIFKMSSKLYIHKEKSIFVSMPKHFAWTEQQVDSV
jgi:hypothetical protein